MSTIGENLKQLRSSKGVTQKQLADYLGVSPVSVQRFEYSTVRPSLDTLIALANFFNCSIDYLVGLSETKERQP